MPLFIAFLEAINRIPAIFEGKFLVYHLGTTPSIGIKSGNYWYIIIIAILVVIAFAVVKSNKSNTKLELNISYNSLAVLAQNNYFVNL